MVGAGGLFAGVQDNLSVVGGLSGAGVNLASTPESAASLLTGLEASGAGLTTGISQTGANLEGVSLNGAAGLSTLTQNAELHSASITSGALVNRAYANTLIYDVVADSTNPAWSAADSAYVRPAGTASVSASTAAISIPRR